MELRGIWPCSVFFCLYERQHVMFTNCSTKCFNESVFFSGVEFVARFFLRSKSLATVLKGWSLFTQTSTNALKPLVTSVTLQRFSFTETEKRSTRCLELVKRGSVIVFGFTPENHPVFMKKINYEICNTFVNSILSFHFGKSFSGITDSLVI